MRRGFVLGAVSRLRLRSSAAGSAAHRFMLHRASRHSIGAQQNTLHPFIA